MIVLKRSLQNPRLKAYLVSRMSGVNSIAYRSQSTIIGTCASHSPNDASNHSLRSQSSLSEAKEMDLDVLNHAVLSASALAHQPQRIAAELDIVEASANKHQFNKILLLINHGEAAMKKNDPLGIPVLTGRGVGQALTLSHQTATFCNNDTGLAPELVVLAPLGHSIQTTLHAFLYNAPDSVRGVEWICHGDLIPENVAPADPSLIARNFPGMDLSLYDSHDRQESFLEWLRGRNEKVIVGKCCR